MIYCPKTEKNPRTSPPLGVIGCEVTERMFTKRHKAVESACTVLLFLVGTSSKKSSQSQETEALLTLYSKGVPLQLAKALAFFFDSKRSRLLFSSILLMLRLQALAYRFMGSSYSMSEAQMSISMVTGTED